VTSSSGVDYQPNAVFCGQWHNAAFTYLVLAPVSTVKDPVWCFSSVSVVMCACVVWGERCGPAVKDSLE
jgi:hypothetical protein